MQWREETGPGRGVQLHLRRVVDPPAPPVLLLHGLGVGGVIWQAFARRLLPHLAAVAPDLRGHGQSDAPPTGYAPTDYAGDLVALVEEFGRQAGFGVSRSRPNSDHKIGLEGRAHDPETFRPPLEDGLESPLPVVGHSLGALVAFSLAELRADLVRWLVLLDPPLDRDLPNPEVASVYRLRHAAPGELEEYLLGRNPGGGRLLAESLSRLFRQASDGAFEALLGIGGQPGHAAERVFEHAAEVRLPVLVLQADPTHGGVLGDAAARAFVDRLPNGTLIKIPGATHALHASHPLETSQAILEFGGYSGAGSSPRRSAGP